MLTVQCSRLLSLDCLSWWMALAGIFEVSVKGTGTDVSWMILPFCIIEVPCLAAVEDLILWPILRLSVEEGGGEWEACMTSPLSPSSPNEVCWWGMKSLFWCLKNVHLCSIFFCLPPRSVAGPNFHTLMEQKWGGLSPSQSRSPFGKSCKIWDEQNTVERSARWNAGFRGEHRNFKFCYFQAIDHLCLLSRKCLEDPVRAGTRLQWASHKLLPWGADSARWTVDHMPEAVLSCIPFYATFVIWKGS